MEGETLSTNPISFRLPFESQISKLPPEHQIVVRTQWNAITDLQGAIPVLKTQIEAMKTAATAAAATAQNITNSSETVVSNPSTIGTVNNQTGNTAYTTLPSDYGAFIILDDAAPVALTLGTGTAFQVPFFVVMLNFGVGLVTATPASGTITYPANLGAASIPIPQNVGAMASYDGANYWTILFPVAPQNVPAVANEFLTAYNSSTGAFSQARPSFPNINGTAATNQIGTGTPSAGEYVDGGTGAWTALPGGISITITTAALTPTGAQGSQTFVNGRLTGQIQAT